MIFDNEGSAFVIGEKNYSGEEAFIHKIDLQTGEVLNEYLIKNGTRRLKYPKLIITQNGFISARATRGEFPGSDGVSVQFYNPSLELVDSVYHEQSIHRACGVNDIILTRDGGFCLLYWECRGFITINRLDEMGNSLWKWDWEAEVGVGNGVKIIETEDGGILYLGTKEFNSTGNKISLLKLDEKGNIQWN